MKSNPVGWFEIPVADMDRAKSFYENVFDCELQIHELGPLVMAWFPWSENESGSPGALVKGEPYVPSRQGTFVYLTAPDIEAHSKRVEENGGKVLYPKRSIGEYGYVAHVIDSEGNLIALHSREG